MKSSLTPLKYVIGRWTHPGTTSYYIKKKFKRDDGTWGPHEAYFQALHTFCNGRGKRISHCKCQGTMSKKCHFNFLLITFFLPNIFRVTKEGMKGRRLEIKKIPKTILCGHIFNQHIHFLVHGHSSWPTFHLRLARGSKALWMHFKNIGPWNNVLWCPDHTKLKCIFCRWISLPQWFSWWAITIQTTWWCQRWS